VPKVSVKNKGYKDYGEYIGLINERDESRVKFLDELSLASPEKGLEIIGLKMTVITEELAKKNFYLEER